MLLPCILNTAAAALWVASACRNFGHADTCSDRGRGAWHGMEWETIAMPMVAHFSIGSGGPPGHVLVHLLLPLMVALGYSDFVQTELPKTKARRSAGVLFCTVSFFWAWPLGQCPACPNHLTHYLFAFGPRARHLLGPPAGKTE